MKLGQETPSMEDVTNIKEGAEDLEELNKAIENAETEDAKEKAFQEAIDHESKLDALENELGLSSEEAKEALVQIYQGAINTEEELKDLFGGDLETSDKETLLSSIKDKMKSLAGAKKVRVAALFLMITMGAPIAAMAEGGASLMENVDTVAAGLNTAKATVVFTAINQEPLSLKNQMTWTKIKTMAKVPSMGESLAEYLQEGVDGAKVSDEDVKRLVEELQNRGLVMS